jgi:protein SCO1/2
MTMRRIRWLLWAAVAMAALAAFAASRLSGGSERTEKGKFGQVPAFSLTDQLGRTLTDRELRGTPWVANFIFTRCPSVCPTLTAKFKALQAKLDPSDEVSFVSFTVDPEHDTPAVLAAYADRFGADPARWRFVTGPMATIEKTVVKGFKMHIGDPEPHKEDPSLIDIMHGEHFVLVDRDGIIRGYYRAEAAELNELAEDLHRLASEGTATAGSRGEPPLFARARRLGALGRVDARDVGLCTPRFDARRWLSWCSSPSRASSGP